MIELLLHDSVKQKYKSSITISSSLIDSFFISAFYICCIMTNEACGWIMNIFYPTWHPKIWHKTFCLPSIMFFEDISKT